MQISIQPITISTSSGNVTCQLANVGVASAETVAITLVPVDDDGNEYPDHLIGLVGDATDLHVSHFLTTVQVAIEALVQTRGL